MYKRQGIYFLSILPEYVLLAGTFMAARGQDGYVHLANVPQKIVFYGLSGLAMLLMVIPLGFGDDKKICKEVRQELHERPRYWKRALAVYWAVIIAIVVIVNMTFPTASENTVPAEKEQVEVPQSYRDYLSLHFMIGARQEVPNEALQRQIDQDERTTRYGQPVYAMQVRATKGDMDGGFRARLLNHTFDITARSSYQSLFHFLSRRYIIKQIMAIARKNNRTARSSLNLHLA